jgi:hypothetical protein
MGAADWRVPRRATQRTSEKKETMVVQALTFFLSLSLRLSLLEDCRLNYYL